MFEYFEKFYIGKLAKGSQTVRHVPSYPIQKWNVVARVLFDYFEDLILVCDT